MEGFVERSVAWLEARLREAGRSRTGEVAEARVRPWGTVLSAPTGEGRVWLKVPGMGSRYEPALHELLARVVPGRVPELIAADPAEGLLLLADAGAALNQVVAGPELIEVLAAALPHYARLQRAMVPYAGEMLAAGVPDMRAAALPAHFDHALHVAEAFAAAGSEPDRAAARLRELSGVRERVRGWCERLERAVVPVSVDHNDLHANNVLVEPGSGHVRFADWGDAVVGHPFAGLAITLGTVAARHELGAGDPATARLRDAYLAEFADLAPHADLVAELELACRLTAITGALTWERALAGASPAVRARYAGDPLRRLSALTHESWLTAPF